jgi:hypothetical protein
MALCGNLKERYVLLIGKSVGLRASDFLSFTYGAFRSLKLDSDAPVSIGQTKTLKEHVNAFPFLDGDAIPIIQQILESNKEQEIEIEEKDKDGKVKKVKKTINKDSDKVLTDTEENLSVILQNLAKKSGVEPHGKRIRFHCLRKFLIDRLSAYASESQWKQIVGKSIEEGAYVTTEQLRSVFGRAMKDIAINGNGGKTKKLIELETELTNTKLILKGMIDAFGVDIYNKAITKLSIQPSEMKSRFRRDSAIPEKETIPYETIIETLKKLASKQ